MLKVLIIESDADGAADLEKKFQLADPISFSHAGPGTSIGELASLGPELAVLGPSLDEETCRKCTHKIKILNPSIPIVLARKGYRGEDGSEMPAFENMYCVPADLTPEEMSRTVADVLKRQSECEISPDAPIIIGQSEAVRAVRQKVRHFADKDITVLTKTRALSIDRNAKTVLVQAQDGTRSTLPYDKLVLGTGSTPRQLPIPGRDLGNVFTVSTLDEAIRIKDRIAGGAGSAVIVGAGFIGLEMAESLADMWGIETTVVEVADQVMPGFLSRTMADIARRHLEEHEVTVHTSEQVQTIEGEDGTVARVVTNKRTIDADLVILAVGVVPNDTLAREAGLLCSERGGIIVSKTMQTSDPDIYAGGDCVLVENLVTGKSGYYPLGSLANRQGRVIGTNTAGGRETFDGALGTFIIKLFDCAFAGTGLSLPVALREGFDAFSTHVKIGRAHV